MSNESQDFSEIELEAKLNTIIDEFIVKRESIITELLLKEWDFIAFQRDWKWDRHKFWDWSLSDLEIRNLQMLLISWKIEDEWEDSMNAKIEKIENEINTKWDFSYSYVFKWIPTRINWSLWWGKSYMRIRIIPQETKLPIDLWIPEVVQNSIRDYKNWWLICIAWPTWSWKSQTIASICQDFFNKEIVNVVTLEDPVEYFYKDSSLALIEQRELLMDFDSFKHWIEWCMRQTPDIVIVQEMRSESVKRAVVDLVEKWVLVITTVHANDVWWIFKSILDAYPVDERRWKKDVLISQFKCFAYQRLVPKKDKVWRVPLFEYVTNTWISQWFLGSDNVQYDNLHQAMTENGKHKIFTDDLFDKVSSWLIDYNEAITYCPPSRKQLLA